MKDEGIFWFLKKEIIILIVLFMVFIPLPPVIVTDVFISVNILFSILILLISIHLKKFNEASILPLFIIFSALLNMYINISVTLYILFGNDRFDGQIIYNLFTLFNSQEHAKILIHSFLYIVITYINIFFLNSINHELLIKYNDSYIGNNNIINLLDRIFQYNFWIILVIIIRSFIIDDLINYNINNDGLSIYISYAGFLEILNNLKTYISYVIALGCNSLLHSIILSLSLWNIKRKMPKEEDIILENI